MTGRSNLSDGCWEWVSWLFRPLCPFLLLATLGAGYEQAIMGWTTGELERVCVCVCVCVCVRARARGFSYGVRKISIKPFLLELKNCYGHMTVATGATPIGA